MRDHHCNFCGQPWAEDDLERRPLTTLTLTLCPPCCDAWDERWRAAGVHE